MRLPAEILALIGQYTTLEFVIKEIIFSNNNNIVFTKKTTDMIYEKILLLNSAGILPRYIEYIYDWPCMNKLKTPDMDERFVFDNNINLICLLYKNGFLHNDKINFDSVYKVFKLLICGYRPDKRIVKVLYNNNKNLLIKLTNSADICKFAKYYIKNFHCKKCGVYRSNGLNGGGPNGDGPNGQYCSYCEEDILADKLINHKSVSSADHINKKRRIDNIN